MLTGFSIDAEGTGAADTVTGKSVSDCKRVPYFLRTYYCRSAIMLRRIGIASCSFEGWYLGNQKWAMLLSSFMPLLSYTDDREDKTRGFPNKVELHKG
jgi:hypothetical protein